MFYGGGGEPVHDNTLEVPDAVIASENEYSISAADVVHSLPRTLGGCTLFHTKNEEGVPCDTMLGSFCYYLRNAYAQADHDEHNGSITLQLPIINHALLNEMRRCDEAVHACTLAHVTLECVAVTRNLLSTTNAQLIPSSLIGDVSERIELGYIRPYYDIVNDDDGIKPLVPKINAYHVPFYASFDGVTLPASAYMRWRPSTAKNAVDYRIAQIRYSIETAVKCFPEIKSTDEFVKLLTQLTASDDENYLRALDFKHACAIRAAMEVLTQYCTSCPYIDDFSFAYNGDRSRRRMETDLICPPAITSGTDCEDGAKMASEIKRIVERNRDAMGEYAPLSDLYAYFAHFVAISYCADPEPTQNTMDKGLCHVVLVMFPKTAAHSMIASSAQYDSNSGASVPRVMRNPDHWTRSVSLLVPETTALADPQLFPPSVREQKVRSDCEEMRASFGDSTGGNPCLSFMSRDAFTERCSRRRTAPNSQFESDDGGGGAGYCPSSFYQYFTDFWTDLCPHTCDLLPVMRRVTANDDDTTNSTRWGVHVADMSAQILLVMGKHNEENLAGVYGSDVLGRLTNSPIELIPRVHVSSDTMKIVDNVLAYQMPCYTVLPARSSEAAATYNACKEMVLNAYRDLIGVSFGASKPIDDTSRYVRIDIYANSMIGNNVSVGGGGGVSAAGTRALLNSVHEEMCKSADTQQFYACNLLCQQIYESTSPCKVTLLLFFGEQGLDNAAAAMRSNNRRYRIAPSPRTTQLGRYTTS